MQIVKLRDIDDHPGLQQQIADVLRGGGLACFPCNGSYRVAADLNDASAVMRLMQSKRRVGKAPALVFVGDAKMLSGIAADVGPVARRLVRDFWPGPLTILFEASPDLPRKVTKQLTKANGRLGVRIPDDDFARGIVQAFGGPLLISSANRENRHGETSAAQVRQTFMHRIDVFADGGDLNAEAHSTVVRVEDGTLSLAREGAIEAAALSEFMETA